MDSRAAGATPQKAIITGLAGDGPGDLECMPVTIVSVGRAPRSHHRHRR